MKDITIKNKSWYDVSISQYEQIMDICNNQELSSAEKDIKLMSIMAEVPESEIWDLPVEDVRLLRLQLAFLNTEMSYPKSVNIKNLKIGDTKCSMLKDVSDMTYAQFMDFQVYIKEPEKYRAELFSIFVIPEGKKYGTGYDVAEYVRLIKDNVSIVLFSSVLHFFVNRSAVSAKVSLTSLAWMIKMKSFLKKGKEKELLKKMSQEIQKEKEVLQGYGFFG